MSVLSGQTIRRLKLVNPMRERFRDVNGNSAGLSVAGYDITADQGLLLDSGEFVLASSAEEFNMPTNVLGIVHDKSSLARRGIAVQNTVIEPGWRGFLTLEVTNHSSELFLLGPGSAIAQVIFHFLDEPAEMPYSGKYQDQQRGPQPARTE